MQFLSLMHDASHRLVTLTVFRGLILKFLVVLPSPFPAYFMSLASRYFFQHFVFKHDLFLPHTIRIELHPYKKKATGKIIVVQRRLTVRGAGQLRCQHYKCEVAGLRRIDCDGGYDLV
jgi:hypothetical protein